MKEEWLKHIHDKMSSFEVDEHDGLWDDLRRNVAAPMPGVTPRDAYMDKKSHPHCCHARYCRYDCCADYAQ